MKMFNRKKGQVWILLVIVVMMFAIGTLYVLFFPAYNMVDNVITPMLSGDWLVQAASVRRAIWLIPVLTFICLLIWMIIQWVKKDNNANPGY
jgi:H+/Cl- antiporter ClcA